MARRIAKINQEHELTNIACLGWGSLIWDPRDLPVRSDWCTDGPRIPLEFARQSKDERITLVIVRAARPMQSLWALMDSYDLCNAIEQLRKREGTSSKYIGRWSSGSPSPDEIPELREWALEKNIDSVVWTALPPKFKDKNCRPPDVEEVLEHLRQLSGCQRKKAEEYIRRAPIQIDTAYRRRIEAELQWLPDASDRPIGQSPVSSPRLSGL